MEDRKQKTTARKLIVLDIDKTLVFSEEFFSFIPKENYDFVIEKNIHVKKRPYLDEFLKTIHSLGYDIAIWTAGSKIYAKKIVDEIIPKGIPLQFVFSRERCTQTFEKLDFLESEFDSKSTVIKKLSKIWRRKTD